MFTLQVVAVLAVVAAVVEGRPGFPEHHITKEVIDYHAHPKYKFDYAVHDPHTGDVKNQWEIRDGDVVKGSYSLMDADGTMRVVEYTADKHNGFNAVVKRTGHAYHPPSDHQYHHHQLEQSEGVVEYAADKNNGFNAVKRTEHAYQPSSDHQYHHHQLEGY